MRRIGAVLCVLGLLVALFGVGAGLSAAGEETFAAEMRAEGFPESYLSGLTALHTAHPAWVFRAQKTGLVWEEVLAAESAVGVSMVPSNSIASWKSCDRGAYNPATGTWYGLDGASWVAASRGIVAYCLDPRNALTETGIFQFENLAYSDTCSVDGVAAILSGTFMEPYADLFMAAGEAAGVSPYHLASRARQEQGSRGNALGLGTASGYAGYYNFFNINAYATSTLSAIQNGARYAATKNDAYYLPWTSPERAIKGGAVILGNSYINRGQNTLYLQKFDVTDGGNGLYTHQYMTNILAPTSEAVSLCAAYSEELKAGAMEFCIPVYEEMPKELCKKPTSTGNNNNLLKSLTVAGQTLTPTFSMYTTEYELTVPTAVNSLTVSAAPSSSAATVSGTGTVPLKAGANLVTVAVTAPGGEVRAYNLSVYRIPGEGGDVTAPPLTSTRYMVGAEITGVAPGTGAEEFLAALSAEGATLSLVTAEGKALTGRVGTGCRVQVIVKDALAASLPVLLRGDVSGDGAMNSLDLLKIQKQILGVAALDALTLKAADVNRDGVVNALDLLRTQKAILGLTTIEQTEPTKQTEPDKPTESTAKAADTTTKAAETTAAEAEETGTTTGNGALL